jgi:nicotinate-nucleotide--dimethylbenzimidazole phosphoribosyltransferase
MQANVVIFATSHGLAQHNISRFSGKGIDNIEIVKQNVHLLQNGESPVNVFCDQAGAGLKVFELGIEIPTADITEQAAMTEREAVATIAYGMEAAASGGDLLVVGETSVAGSTIASSLCAALFDEAPSYWVGNGTGITTEFYAKKVGLVAKAIELHKSSQGKPLEILRCLGGREIAAIIGAIIAARHQNIPVLLDGYVSVAAAAVLWEIDANSIDHCCFADCTQERGHQRLLEKMSKKTLTQYGIHLGQGAGAVLSINIMKAAAQYHMFGKTDQSQKSTILAVS